jgi:hypothetical protein
MTPRKTFVVLSLALTAAGAGLCLAWTPLRSFWTSQRDRAVAAALGTDLVTTSDVIRQRSDNDCGPAALSNLLHLRGVLCTPADVERLSHMSEMGTSMLQLRDTARLYGVSLEGWIFDPTAVRDVPTPFLALQRHRHFVVVVKVAGERTVEILDPAVGRLLYPMRRFERLWTGLCLVPAATASTKSAREDLGRQVESPIMPDRIMPRTGTISERR